MADPEQIGPDIDLISACLGGKHSSDQERIAVEGVAWVAMLLRKNIDYGSSVYQAPVLKPSLNSGDAILVRASDKVQRIRSLLAKLDEATGALAEPMVASEKLEDTLRDLGSYCLLWLTNPNRIHEPNPKPNPKPDLKDGRIEQHVEELCTEIKTISFELFKKQRPVDLADIREAVWESMKDLIVYTAHRVITDIRDNQTRQQDALPDSLRECLTQIIAAFPQRAIMLPYIKRAHEILTKTLA